MDRETEHCERLRQWVSDRIRNQEGALVAVACQRVELEDVQCNSKARLTLHDSLREIGPIGPIKPRKHIEKKPLVVAEKVDPSK
jgi:hypothetical protein